MSSKAEISAHLKAGKYYGRDAVCGPEDKPKVNYKSFETANKMAEKLSVKYGKTMEAYPCYWCRKNGINGWHIGRAMNPLELAFFKGKVPDSEMFFMHYAEPLFGCQIGKRPVLVHSRKRCEGQFCSIHNPSDHPLKDAELNWRADRRIMERICEHGAGHPDPDDASYRMFRDPENFDPGTHGCDGCCR